MRKKQSKIISNNLQDYVYILRKSDLSYISISNKIKEEYGLIISKDAICRYFKAYGEDYRGSKPIPLIDELKVITSNILFKVDMCKSLSSRERTAIKNYIRLQHQILQGRLKQTKGKGRELSEFDKSVMFITETSELFCQDCKKKLIQYLDETEEGYKERGIIPK